MPPLPRAVALAAETTPGVVERSPFWWVLGTLAALVAAPAAAVLLGALLERLARRRPAFAALARRERWPLATVLGAAVLRLSVQDLPAAPARQEAAGQLTTVALLAALTWACHRALLVGEAAAMGRFDVGRPDNLRARTIRTQVQVLRRLASVGLVVIAVLAGLRTFPWGRDIGTSILAAGGLVGVVVGVAGKSTLGNVIAGIQLAIAEPVRLDDVVVVEGEMGNVEEITLSYVVVRLWDKRRLVLPTSYFVEEPFENWTHRSADVLGTVLLWADPTVDVEQVRQEVFRLLEHNRRWDGRKANVQVTEAQAHAMQLRVVVSARTAPDLWDLRCDVREGLVRWLAAEHPDALARVRIADADERRLLPA